MLLENELPEGRVTNKQAAAFVADEVEAQGNTLRGWIESYVGARIDSLRDSLHDGEQRFRVEMRAWLAGAVMLNALHPAGVAVSALAALGSVVGVHAVARFFNR